MTISLSCCAYINTSSQVETSIDKIRQQATWLQQTLDHHTPLFQVVGDWFCDLFSWIPAGLKSLLVGIIKLGLTFLLLILILYVTFKVIMLCITKICK